MIYNDIDRPGGSAWSQILSVCLGEIHAIALRIQDTQTPCIPNELHTSLTQVEQLPKLGASIKSDDIFPKPKPQLFSEFRGRSSNASNIVEVSATKLVEYAAQRTLNLKPVPHGYIVDLLTSIAITILKTPFGAPFRRTLARKATAVVLGYPTSSVSTISDAVSSLSKLVVHSKKEDTLGTVYRDIPAILRTLVSTHDLIELCLQTLTVHWTDVWHKETDRRPEDVEILLHSIREALGNIISEFGEYSENLGLSAKELRIAKGIVVKNRGKRDATSHVNHR